METNPRTAKDVHEKRNKLWDASLDNHKQFLDKTTGLFASQFLEQRHCPACGSESSIFLFHKSGGSYEKCTHCDMVFTNPVFTDSALTEYYSHNHNLQAEIVNEDNEFYRSIYKKGLDLIAKEIPNPQRIFDFGCSSGFFLDVAKSEGWQETWGVELNKSEFEVVKQKGHQVFNQPIEELSFEKKFDVISLWDVFEHLKDGMHFLDIFRGMLSDNGGVFLQIPSSASLAARLMQDKCNMFDGLEHVNLYGPKSIQSLAKRANFEIVHMQTVIPEINVLNNYVNYENPYTGNQPATNELFGFITPELLEKELLGYKLQIFLKPKK